VEIFAEHDERRTVSPLNQLQAFTAALSRAVTSEQVAEAILTYAQRALGADAGIVYRLGEDEIEFVLAGVVGYPRDVSDGWRRFAASPSSPPIDAPDENSLFIVPLIAAVHSSYAQVNRFLTGHGLATAVGLPLLCAGRIIGGLGLRFRGGLSLSEHDRTTLTSLAAEALARSRKFEAEQATRIRLESELSKRTQSETLEAAERRYAGSVAPGSEQSSERLRESEEEFHLLADSIPQLAWMARADGHIYWYNRRWYDYTGTTLERMQGWGWQSVHDPQQLPKVVERWESCIATGEPFDMVFPLKGADGRSRWFLTRVVPLRGRDGHILQWFGTNTDITELREMEDALRDADRRKDEFLAMLAHELRNPLAPIRTAAQIIKLAGSPDSKIQLAREMIERQVGHLARLVDDLLDVSRITRGKIKLHNDLAELSAIVARGVEASKPLIDARRQHLTLHLPSQPMRVQGDATRLAQVVSNLLDNAAKYTDEGGRIELTLEAKDGKAVVSVRDNGMGISADLLPHVFDLFRQGDRSSDRSQGGLGIGLTLVKSLMELHGGTIDAHSAGPGKGSEFVVKMPLIAAPELDLPAAADHDRKPRPAISRRVLVVDDNMDAALSLAMLFEGEGHYVCTTRDGASALEIARTFRPEIVLLDIGLPRMDGYEVAKRLREQPETRDTFLIALTGYGQEEDRRRTAQAGFNAHLTKPADPVVLLQLLADPR
jgi:PAS domain S-box-containing protein